jgi:hypothetical protein
MAEGSPAQAHRTKAVPIQRLQMIAVATRDLRHHVIEDRA